MACLTGVGSIFAANAAKLSRNLCIIFSTTTGAKEHKGELSFFIRSFLHVKNLYLFFRRVLCVRRGEISL